MNGRIIENTEMGADHFLLRMAVPGSFGTPMPGQFVMVRETGRIDPLLGRPFGVYRFERENGEATVEILYKTVGKGTRLFANLKKSDSIDIYGPFGRPFDVDGNAGTVVLLCGGIGVAPITCLAARYRNQAHGKDARIVCYYGARSRAHLIGVDRIEKVCDEMILSTDDGSAGFRGEITERFAKDASSYDAGSRIYACGPRAMLRQLSGILLGREIPCQVLMEERMACGVGACLGCTVLLKDACGKGRARVCVDGPVFEIGDIRWD
ncbi:MAG TPA: dihydroorotate dehydrogenase electron transfer subunit [Syntrophales bacterium]|nr:dihydroorotate dehydrogenase electron transfer subunit [Syntrophales bacterium]